ncbi:Rz1-like lysis system protein LysC [Vibrio scophthalmi]|uniref:Uncharacterized protein n=1 Tax=Vibrio scophthalmi TaxID=45658 RepID=A0A1E3WJT0_9VIBR|nr:hypothetical protein VSF3289_03229 [Vibrio scophthalmi]
MSLLSILILGCQDTQIITQYEYKEVLSLPPASALVGCELPFKEKPRTYGEAALRDEVWLSAFLACACKIEKNREHYQYSADLMLCKPQ